MHFGRRLAVSVLFVALAAGAGAKQPAAKTPEPHAPDQATIKQMVEAQKWAGEQIWHIREQVNALPGLIDEDKEGNAATQEEVGKLRDEVKGLYVEISSLKQQIDSVRDDIGGVDSNVYRFRTYTGFFLALMLLMVAVILAMSIRR
jgi:peptidoglycan hydrolase CwlO-like protein